MGLSRSVFQSGTLRMTCLAILAIAVIAAPVSVPAQTAPDTTAALVAVVRSFYLRANPLAVHLFDAPGSTSVRALRGVMVRSVPVGFADVIETRPVALRAADPLQQRTFDEAALIPLATKYAGSVRIDSLDFAGATRMRVHYEFTINLTPRPSYFSIARGWLTVDRTIDGAWLVKGDEVREHADGYYGFAPPDFFHDEFTKQIVTKTRAILTARGIAVP